MQTINNDTCSGRCFKKQNGTSCKVCASISNQNFNTKMKAKVNYNDKQVEIELTEEQIEKINNTKFGDYRDIQTFEDACEVVGEKWAEPKGLAVDIIAYMKLRIIAKALNGGSSMTYQDTDEGKYYPYFNATGSASGFSFYDFDFDRSSSYVGSRLVFKSAEIAKYAGSQFLEIYNQYIN